jgi:hypothetical protein
VYRLAKPRQLDKLRERIRECSLWHEAQLRERADQRMDNLGKVIENLHLPVSP